MTTKKVMDAYGLLVLLGREPGYEQVEALITSAEEDHNNILMTSVNFGEVFYRVLRKLGEDKAAEADRIIHGLPINILDVSPELAKVAARIKAFKRMHYADCFAAALAKIHDGEVITGDKDFKLVEDEVKIAWIV
ncbi:MAG: type II toxin-antitoxin system VapC family toxin [Chloroflexi bacterium]|nr:type II toxin-antitoxin system VapC family toxin [Chloroflexota bacterium]